MRRRFNTLAVQAEKVLEFDPYSGHLFVFRGRRGDLLKIIWWDDQGLEAVATKALGATVQRCRVHFMRNALACVGKQDRPMIVTAAVRTAFDQDTRAASKDHWAKLIDACEPRHPKACGTDAPRRRRHPGLQELSQRPLGEDTRIQPAGAANKEIKRRTNVVGIFPNEAAVTRLVGVLMLEQNDGWAITGRYMTLKTVAAICDTALITAPMGPTKIAAL